VRVVDHEGNPLPGFYRNLDGDAETVLIATACSESPEGFSRWTFQLLADRRVALKVVDSIISPECARTTLKKTKPI